MSDGSKTGAADPTRERAMCFLDLVDLLDDRRGDPIGRSRPIEMSPLHEGSVYHDGRARCDVRGSFPQSGKTERRKEIDLWQIGMKAV